MVLDLDGLIGSGSCRGSFLVRDCVLRPGEALLRFLNLLSSA